jgi:hypothetical protein
MHDANLKLTTTARAAADDGLLDEADAVRLLGLESRKNPRGTLRWLCRTRKLAYVDLARGIRRFRQADLQAYIERQRVAPLEE